MRKPLPVLVLAALILACEEDQPIVVSQRALPTPSNTPLIDRSALMSGNNFAIGYANGNIRSNKVTLTWQPSLDADFLGYRVLRGGSLIRTLAHAQATTVTDTNLTQNTYYTYTLAILTRQGTHSLDSVRVRTPLFQAPTVGSQVLADTLVRLTWNRSTESATGYLVERRLASGPSFAVVGTTAVLSYDDHPVQNFTQYFYRVAAFSPYETTATSTPASVSLNVIMSPPVIDSLEQLVPTRAVSVVWRDNSNFEAGFRIYRRRGTGGVGAQIGEVGANITVFTDRDTNALRFDSTYSYSIEGFYARGTTGRSIETSITIQSSWPALLSEGFEGGVIPTGWTVGGHSPWYVTSTSPYTGSHCARSGPILANQSSFISQSLPFSSQRNISFHLRVSSEAGSDFLRFFINGVLQRSWSGELDWQWFSTPYTGSGLVTLRWEYAKNGSGSSGQDCAWIDNVVVQ